MASIRHPREGGRPALVACLAGLLALALGACAHSARLPSTGPLQDAGQHVLVTTPGWNADHGTLRRYERRDGAWQAVGTAVSELSTAFSQSIEMGARLEDVAHTIHAHPTLGEAVQEAALRALGQALHV